MDLGRKLELAESAIRSIAEHDDLPETDVRAALAQLMSRIKAHAEAMKARRAEKRT